MNGPASYAGNVLTICEFRRLKVPVPCLLSGGHVHIIDQNLSSRLAVQSQRLVGILRGIPTVQRNVDV